MKEIFINRTYNAKNIEENIRLIGTCNPYRLKTEKEENSGLSHPYKTKGLAYDVNILPQSLMYFVFNFGYLEKENEEKYIKSILSNHFKNFDIGLINIVKEIISKCHQYLRQLYDYSIVSLREIKRFLKLYDNLMKYYNNKDELDLEKNTKKSEEKKNKKKKNKESIEEMNVINEKLKVNEIKSLIVATYLNYYTRLIDKAKRTNFESELKENLIKLANYYSKDQNKGSEDQTKNNENQNDTKDNYTNSLDIKWKPLLNDYKNFKSENNTNYSIFFENECDYIIDNINLDKGIAKNRILKENIFLQFIAITSNIPLIIIGKPGSSKSLSFQQLKKSMRGNYSKSNFFRKYPQILTTYFQGSESTLADDIDNLFEIGREKLRKYDNDKNKSKPISLIIFDEIGLSEFAKDNPVKVLHKNLEYDNIKDGLSFVGFSNWKLDSSKLNRVLYLSVPDLDMDIDALNETAKCIAESILENNIDHKLLRLLSRSYQSYQNMIKKIKDYVVYKELELQEMKHVLDTLTQDEIKKNFNNNKKDITLADFIKKRELIETNKIYSWKHGSFINVKIMPEFKDLYLKNKSINQEFHGNRDFYNYIKGVCNIKSLSKILENNDSDISEQIEKVIERNFGGVDINLDIDFALKYNDESIYMEKLKGILNKYPNYKKQLKIPSFFLFKYIFNDELKSLNEENGDSEDRSDEADNLQLDKLRINEDNLTKYNLNECINGNINDNDARYLLLEIEEGLKYLICQNIISQNIGKNIEYMEGSPFINDIKDKNGEYKIKKISEIQNYCNKEMVLILSNLNQIYAFLYDFFNRNFIITDDKKYGRICQGNFTEQLTYIHDNFRIIIMIDKNYVHKQESPFLNRFEKAIVKFEELLDNKQKASSKNIFQELKIKEQMETININYNIKNLLINCNEENIDRLYFYYSNQKSKKGKMQDNEIKEKIFEKIARTLPQDIIIHLDDKHPIKKIYNKKNIFSFKDYMNHLSKLNGDAEQKKDVSSAVTSTKCKFSIIYTFTDIISNIEGINEKDAPQMISEIKRESQLIDLINEKKFKSKQTNNNFYIMHFYQHELDKINFIISTLKIHYGNEDIIFIFIVHIKRIMDKKKKEKIYSIPDVDEKVDQIFIDNLNGLTISLEDLAKNGIRQILDDSKLVDKNNEFLKALKAYFNSYTDKLHFIDNYLPKIIKYFDKNKEFIEIILSKSLDLIYKESNNKDKGKNNENIEYFNEIKKEIFANSYINHNTIDIVSSIINDVIIGKRIRGSIMKVIDALESNNFLTTLLTLDNKTENNSFTSKENLCQMMEMYLDSVKFEEIQGKASFQSNYFIPGFLCFYNLISNFISKNITESTYRNEKKFRDYLKGNIPKLKNDFLLEEERLLDIVCNEINTDESDNYKFINEFANKCPNEYLLNDYINYFLNINSNETFLSTIEREREDLSEIGSNTSNFEDDEQNIIEEEENDDFYQKIIKQIIDLRYKDDTKIIINNKDNEFNKFLIKIIWLEANKNYIFTIIQLFNEVKNKIYRDKKRNILLKQISKLISDNKIKYMTDENRNPEHTREVNECYYIILGSLYLAITDLEKIILYDPDNNKDYVEAEDNQVKVKIEKYLECLNYIVKVSQPFNDMLYLFSNELYIIVELNSIINLLKLQKNEYIDIQVVKNITKNLRENIDIIRENKFVKINALKESFVFLINLISENLQYKDKKYYALLRDILIQEFMKVKDKNYRLDIFKSYVIKEKEILLNSNEIFDLLFKGFFIPLKEKILLSIEKFENRIDEILLILEDKIKEKKNEYLSQILLYYYEKMSHIYFDNYFKSKCLKKNEKNLLEKEPLDVFKKCLDLLSKFNSSKSKIKNVSKLVYIGYIRVFLFKFEEYIREKSDKLLNPKVVINTINEFKNRVSFMVELFYYKVIYNKNNKDINIVSSNNNMYNLESLNNKGFFFSKINDNNSDEENEDEKYSIIDLLEDKEVNIIKNSNEEYPFKEYFYYSDYIEEKYLTSIIKNEGQKYPVLDKYLELMNNGNLLNDFYVYNNALYCLNEEYSSKITRDFANKETLNNELIYKNNQEMFDEFFDIFNKLSDYNEDENIDNDNDNENDNKINKKLKATLPLSKFLLTNENEFYDQFKYIYSQFIDKHNEIVENLLKAKSKDDDVQNQNKDKIKIENITKENEIFITKKDFSFYNVLFNNSYRKVIISDDYSEFNKYEINLEYIEEIMTDKLLKNKKFISDEIFQFNYKNEFIEFKNKDICTKFQQKIAGEELSLNDKIIIYEYFDRYKGNVNLHIKIIDDFVTLIKYSNQYIDEIEPSQTKIYTLLEKLDYISSDFKEIFKERNNLTLNKLLNIYDYYQILCFNKVIEKLIPNQKKITDKEIKNLIDNFIKNDLKTKEKKEIVEIAIRKFILCFLLAEKDKEKKIKENENNIKNYLDIEDLWNKDFYKKNEFYQVLKKLKDLSIKINNVIWFYEISFKNMYKNYFDDVKQELQNREEERKKKEKEMENDDLRNFNPNNVDIDDNPKETEENGENGGIDNNANNNNENNENEGDNDDDYLDQPEEEDEDYGGRY